MKQDSIGCVATRQVDWRSAGWFTANMAGRTREPGPTSMRAAGNLRRLRQERGLSYAELSRRLTAIGHPIVDTSLLKIEKGDVDDLVALAVVLGTTPNRLILPPGEPEHSTEPYELTAAITETPLALWAWATGEVPLGRLPSSATTDRQTRAEESAFSRENRPQHWIPGLVGAQETFNQFSVTVAVITVIYDCFRQGASTRDIRSLAETALMGALTTTDPTQVFKVEQSEDGDFSIAFEEPADKGAE